MNPLVRSTAEVTRLLAWAPRWLVAGMLLFTATGCYTQLAGTYRDYDREPDYVEVQEYEGEYGDSVVVSRYYYDDAYYDDYYDQPYRYRHYFSRFYGYPSYGGYYGYNDPFYYDPFYYGSGLHIGFGYGHHYGYNNPWYYGYSPYGYGGYYGGYYGYPYSG